MKCRACGSEELKLVLDLGSQPWGNDYQLVENFKSFNKYPLELFFCSTCSLSQINFTVPREVMFISHTYLSGTTRTLKKHFEQTSTAVIEQFSLNKNDLILDIGGNDGSYLEFFYELGYKTLNVDSGTHQALISKSKGIPTINDFFSESVTTTSSTMIFSTFCDCFFLGFLTRIKIRSPATPPSNAPFSISKFICLFLVFSRKLS